MRPRRLLPAALAALLLAAPGSAAAARYVPGEVIVKYRDGTAKGIPLPGGSRRLEVEDGESVRRTLTELRADPSVAYAVPNYIARASVVTPNDPGFRLQWNLSGEFGIRMPQAWSLARQRGAPGGRGVVVAVLDTGVAYRNLGRRFRRAPDLDGFERGYDFVDGDRYPLDLNGHGTHVSGTIAQTTNNGRGAAGVAYRARIMPVRVLDAEGAGDTVAISRALRFAARRRVDVINMSLEFDSEVRASQIPDIVSALRYARRRGVLVIGAAGNQADAVVAYPARSRSVVAVGATTERGCQADYSNSGFDIDIAAPGGGADAANADNPWDAAHCQPDLSGRQIYQQTFVGSVRRFGLPPGYEGTSMAAPHVSGVAALVIATKRIGANPSPRALALHLQRTSNDLGPPGFDARYGAGMLNAEAALK